MGKPTPVQSCEPAVCRRVLRSDRLAGARLKQGNCFPGFQTSQSPRSNAPGVSLPLWATGASDAPGHGSSVQCTVEGPGHIHRPACRGAAGQPSPGTDRQARSLGSVCYYMCAGGAQTSHPAPTFWKRQSWLFFPPLPVKLNLLVQQICTECLSHARDSSRPSECSGGNKPDVCPLTLTSSQVAGERPGGGMRCGSRCRCVSLHWRSHSTGCGRRSFGPEVRRPHHQQGWLWALEPHRTGANLSSAVC